MPWQKSSDAHTKAPAGRQEPNAVPDQYQASVWAVRASAKHVLRSECCRPAGSTPTPAPRTGRSAAEVRLSPPAYSAQAGGMACRPQASPSPVPPRGAESESSEAKETCAPGPCFASARERSERVLEHRLRSRRTRRRSTHSGAYDRRQFHKALSADRDRAKLAFESRGRRPRQGDRGVRETVGDTSRQRDRIHIAGLRDLGCLSPNSTRLHRSRATDRE